METWRKIQRENFTSWGELLKFLKADLSYYKQLNQSPSFPLNLPKRLAAKIEPGNLADPILLQFLPTLEENKIKENFSLDPIGDVSAQKAPKLLHKYHGRALLLTSSACAMHCRYCFRQHFEYAHLKGFEEELTLLSQDSSIEEIILSGGDPLSLSNRHLQDLIRQLEMIPHLKRLRFHTRFPIGIPERIDQDFLTLLKESRFQTWFVIHCNHLKELDSDILQALKQIQSLGIPILNQTVLLKGVNDTLPILESLFSTLVNHGISPYYLHQLDRTAGTAHFEVDESIGHDLIKKLSARLPGFAIPRYVREIEGEPSKTLLILR